MLQIIRYQTLRFLRAPVLMLWTLGFPMILSLIFMLQFSNLGQSFEANPMPLGLVTDAHYDKEENLQTFLDTVSDPEEDNHYINFTEYASIEEAKAAATKDSIEGYIHVVDGDPQLVLTDKGNSSDTSLVIRALLDTWMRTNEQATLLLENGANPQDLTKLTELNGFTEEIQVTKESVEHDTRYYFALLAFACGSGISMTLSAISGVMASSGPIGARQTMAGLARWKVLLASFTSGWLCSFACLFIAWLFMWKVIGVNFGPNTAMVTVAIAIATLMSSAIGAFIGTFKRIDVSSVSGITALLSLFTGLYGPGARALADTITESAPWAMVINPLWQVSQAFYALLYFDSLTPFSQHITAILIITAVFLVLALIRMRRIRHEHL
ncbi:MAG: ABC transporter permease [Actinomycetaceae bacterium]|nr:ABC transporter permease [Actinomycetaceae bacterium]